MDLSSLKAFVKVVQTGSFTRAAEALGSQKAHLSRQVTQLERALGARLLERTTRSLSLTEIGREFFERSVGILASVEDAQRAVQKAQGEPRGTLKLTCGVEFGMMAVGGWINSYLSRYPQMRVQSEFTGRVVDIVHEGFDLAIRIGTLQDSSLTARKLGEVNYGIYAAPDYLERRGKPLEPADLQAHSVLAFSGGSMGTSGSLSKGSETQKPALSMRWQANNVFALRDAAVAGLGLARLPNSVARADVLQGRLEAVLQDWRSESMPVHAVFASARYMTPKVRAFVDLALDQMRLHQADQF